MSNWEETEGQSRKKNQFCCRPICPNALLDQKLRLFVKSVTRATKQFWYLPWKLIPMAAIALIYYQNITFPRGEQDNRNLLYIQGSEIPNIHLCLHSSEKLWKVLYSTHKINTSRLRTKKKKTRIQYTEMSGKTEQEWPFVISIHAYGTWTAVRCLHVRSFFRRRRTRCSKNCTLSFLFPAISYSFLKRMVNLWLNFPA